MKLVNKDKRFIEETFPVKEVSFESYREKNIRHGHISTLHVWWARRPLASSRATNYAALIPAADDIDEWNKKRQFIIDFSKWENSLNQTMIDRARKDILKANGGKPPKVLDPFGGGGAIPLEALRLGCETYSNDLNPVAVLIQKCTLEYPQKYGKPGEIEREVEHLGTIQKQKVKVENKLLEDVKKWGEWVLNEVKKEIGVFYPNEKDGSIPLAYIWARTIPCQNPNCGAEIPLIKQLWLAKKPKKKVALFPYVKDQKAVFKIVGDGYEKMPSDFDPTKGTVARAVATCVVCGSVVDAKTTRKLFQKGTSGERMIALVMHMPGSTGKKYRIATDDDIRLFRESKKYLKERREELMVEWGIDPIPDEELPIMSGVFNTPIYGLNTWGSLFNSRQKLALITFVNIARKTYGKLIEDNCGEEYAKAVVSYLSLSIDRLATRNSNLCVWHNGSEQTEKIFGMQALPMKWSYPESNPLTGKNVTGLIGNIRSITSVLEVLSAITYNMTTTITQSSATLLPYGDDYFDAIFTDPPYYNSVPYADLSDFFYVWLKRCVGDLYPDLFSTPLSQKGMKLQK